MIGASRIETQGKRSNMFGPCELLPRRQSCRRGRREEREPVVEDLRFLVMVQEHDLVTCNPVGGECTLKRRSVKTRTECDGEFGVLQSENGDKSTGAACPWSSGENTITG